MLCAALPCMKKEPYFHGFNQVFESRFPCHSLILLFCTFDARKGGKEILEIMMAQGPRIKTNCSNLQCMDTGST